MSDIKGLREISNDPFGKLLTALSKKFSAFLAKDQAELVENPEDVYSDGQDVESALKWHNFVMTKKFDLNTQYYSTSEPDYDHLRLWLIARQLGNTLRDSSAEGRTIILWGDPILVDGAPFDWGIADASGGDTKSIAIRLNRSTSTQENEEFVKVEHDARIRAIEALTTGISFFIRFRVFDLAQQNGTYRTLFAKVDDSTPNNGIRVFMRTGGELVVHILDGGTAVKKETVAGTITTDTVYDLWVTYDTTTNTLKVYLNNVDKTLSDSALAVEWADTTDLGLSIFRLGPEPLEEDEKGYINGDLYDFRIYGEKIVSATEVSRMWTNKWSIANIPFGQVMISNYWVSIGEVATPSAASFTSSSFTSSSWET